MESSEDDAGAAANASRRVSAREKDVGQIEDVNATSSFHQDPSEQRTSCETPAMSEDNFDGDSVPSPSTQDVNTSTEAILDMIDEIVDGPGAPKRLPFALENDTDSRFAGGGDSNKILDIKNEDNNDSLKYSHSDPTTSAKIEEQSLQKSSSNILNIENKNPIVEEEECLRIELPQNSSCEPNSDNIVISIVDTQKATVSCSVEPQNSIIAPAIPSSSVTETVQTGSASCERTVKCVTSSDSRDNVVVESAESTSSDNSISDIKIPTVDSATKSPLRRKLVRPLPNKPDSTVSSTVDSSVNIQTSEQASKNIVKDVSSSSDAVPVLQGNDKHEETKSISEVSICKAESCSPSKKIKLIRQKIVPQASHMQVECNSDIKPLTAQIEQCQSTSEPIKASVNSCTETVVENKPIDDKCDVQPEVLPCKSPDGIKEPLLESTNQICHKDEEVSHLSTSFVSNETVESKTEKIIEETPSIKNIHLNNETEFTNTTSQCKENEDSNLAIEHTDPEESDVVKQVPKLTIKLSNKAADEIKPPLPKLTIKPVWPPCEAGAQVDKGQIPHIRKLNIKLSQQPERINEIHRKSSSSEISESEYSENDESTSTSDQASASDQGPSDIVPKVTIKLGKPGTESEGQFYTEKNVSKSTKKIIQNSDVLEQHSPTKLKVVLSQSEDTQIDKVPKLTIKAVAKCESQPLSPKLIIKPIKPPDDIIKDSDAEHSQYTQNHNFCTPTDIQNKDLAHIPKITIKPVTKSYDSADNIPVVTKLNIKPLVKPDNIEFSECSEEKVPVVSKLIIKPIVKPKDSEIDNSRDDVPKITKLNIKPLKSPETNSSEEKDCDVLKADIDENSIPVVTKLNIKPIVKPLDEDSLRDNENQSSETGNSSDDNADQIPIVTKINIKPICKQNYEEESGPSSKKEDVIPVVTKLNIKPLVKPDETVSPQSPKKEISKIAANTIPVVTKLNIKPVVKPENERLKEMSDQNEDISVKNPPLVMKINRKTVVNEDQYSINKSENEHCNNINDPATSVISKYNIIPEVISGEICHDNNLKVNLIAHSNVQQNDTDTNNLVVNQNCVNASEESIYTKGDIIPSTKENINEVGEKSQDDINKLLKVLSGSPQHKTSKGISENQAQDIVYHDNTTNAESELNISLKISNERLKAKSTPIRQNCTLLKKLLENKKDKVPEGDSGNKMNTSIFSSVINDPPNASQNANIASDVRVERLHSDVSIDSIDKSQIKENKNILACNIPLKSCSIEELCKEANENLTKPLEINISEKYSHSSDQDSPRIIIKINKTDQGASAKIITEETKKSDIQVYSPKSSNDLNDTLQKKNLINSRRKPHVDTPMPMGKRLRSSRILQTSDNSPNARRNIGKRTSTSESESPPQTKEPELSVLETKRLKLGQLLSNKSLTITPVVSKSTISPPIRSLDIKNTRNHSILNNENCAKNGSSKLHNILSNLQAKQLHALDLIHPDNSQSSSPDLKSSTSAESPELISDNASMDKSRPEVQIVFHENSESRDFSAPEEMARDPLEVDSLRSNDYMQDIPKPVEMTPQPKKRGRPRKLPVSEGAKTVTLPVPALEERPQRSLRLSRDRPVILVKPRGRGRGRGRRLDTETNPMPAETVETANNFFAEQKPEEEIDPTSSRIKLPRMTEALDKMPSVCSTPLTSRRRTSSTDMPFFGSNPDLKVVLESTLPKMEDPFLKSPEMISENRGRGNRGGRGSRGGRGRAATRSPRGRGRGRGGGRGAMYMKETMGIYGRVCGPATTTVQLFEEETCMMDDNATPAKSSHLLDEDSQSSVKSSTNDSNKMKKSKFADLFDSNKVWTAADVKEYTWPPPETTDGEPQVMMIQEQVAMFLNVKSFKRRYPELKRRTITGEERDYVLSKGLVTEALCDLGITAVDASEVLDIMLSDYPHKYEEFRSHQRVKQLAEPVEDPLEEIKLEIKNEKIEIKDQKSVESKPEPPKVDPEKTRQDMAAAAIASAGEFNARLNALRRPACADLQSLTVQRRRAPPPAPRLRVRPPHGFYPHALLPGQYQHTYRVYAPDELRYFPLNTALAAPPAPASPPDTSSESEGEWGSRCSSSDSERDTRNAKRKKLTKTKRCSSQAEAPPVKEEEVDTCRVCSLRLEANRKYTHERFLVCANCNAKLHPSCIELGPDTIRKCREYAWQCAECKTCCACARPADDDKMLFCDLCDRGFHIYCVGLRTVPTGRWHCVECAICKSCGARDPGGLAGAGGAGAAGAGPAEWHHQTRRGPGGHKLYSHSLCTPCARAYRIGRYCPLCDRSFIGPKGTMQLVICKLCDRQHHQECVRATVATLNVLDYTCGECRRGGITSRAAAVRLAPRTIATLFMAKRRFNKYAHRQYLQSRQRAPDAADAADAGDATDAADAPDDTDELSL